MDKRTIVVALGGNALGNDIDEQKIAVMKTAKVIVDLAQQDLNIVITHGNGPQVGMIQTAMDNVVVRYKNYKQVPLPGSIAMSQGYIGLDLQNAIKYELVCRGLDAKVSTILSQIEVDKNDPAFQHPTKPIGRFMTKEEAEINEAHGIPCMEDAGRGYRIVVPSPMPKRVRELETVKTLMNAGHIVIACGGGGMPVIEEDDGQLRGVNAVVDKDNVSCLLAERLDADQLVILTAVEHAALNFRKENEVPLTDITVEKAKQYVAEGHFAPGSMLPKVEASIRFAESKPGRRSLITLLDKAGDGIAGKTGTSIHL